MTEQCQETRERNLGDGPEPVQCGFHEGHGNKHRSEDGLTVWWTEAQ